MKAETQCPVALEQADGSKGPEETDLELVEDVRTKAWEAGGSEAFWTLWLRYETVIWRTVRGKAHLMHPRHVPKEVFAEALLERVETRLRRGAGGYRGPAPFRAFLGRVIHNAAIDQIRHYRPRPTEIGFPEPALVADEGEDAPGGYRCFSFPSPDRVAAARERREIIQVALHLVGRHSRAAVRWAGAIRRFYFEKLTGPEIAEEMGCTEAAVQQYLSRGRKAMRAVLEERFGFEDGKDLIP